MHGTNEVGSLGSAGIRHDFTAEYHSFPGMIASADAFEVAAARNMLQAHFLLQLRQARLE